ncbi:uncharacterized protein G2W53_022385 [Senna tora]|uniref:Uncharacterized protein n=1 Tax=Senna tora TaxID=362788 RepID=A0A834WM24_9FABA|nr:uncharacterized protein G2W53_022385 [Senna tora]
MTISLAPRWALAHILACKTLAQPSRRGILTWAQEMPFLDEPKRSFRHLTENLMEVSPVFKPTSGILNPKDKQSRQYTSNVH